MKKLLMTLSGLFLTAKAHSWGGYQLGDVVKGISASHLGWYRLRKRYERIWPESIATEYLKRTTDSKRFDILCSIARSRGRKAKDLPGPHDVVVHLRLGDVADRSRQTAASLWQRGSGSPGYYIKGAAYYDKIAMDLHKNVSKVFLVGWNHHGSYGNHETSNRYRDYVLNFFESKGYKVVSRWENSPDDDFIFMVHAATFVYGGGGFSRIIGECVRRFNATLPVPWQGQWKKAFSCHKNCDEDLESAPARSQLVSGMV
jgi:hypothetical protein